MKWIFYNLVFAAVYPFLLPGFLLRMFRRGGYAARMGDRFALYPKSVLDALGATPDSHDYRPGEFVWIHAVSVGEVQVAGQLMREWRKADPKVRFCFSTTSSTGWKMAEKELEKTGGTDVLVYNPLDFPNFVKSALRTVRPRAIVLTESEIWPNFIRQAKKCAVPLFLINARVSDRSAPRYRRGRLFFADVFNSFTRIFAQSDLDKARIVAAGADPDRIEVSGSFKFDVAHRNPEKEAELSKWIFGANGAKKKVLLGGSTWPGEDEALLKIYKSLLSTSTPTSTSTSTPLLVIAPRHFEKADAVEANIRAAGFTCIRRSRGDQPQSTAGNHTPSVYLADTTGELMGLYALADVVFVGKSLCAHGSQNMIEPCLCGKPTVVGPFTENFRPVMSDLKAADAIVQVADEAALGREILSLVSDQERAAALGKRATAAVERRRGVVSRCLAVIIAALAGCSRQSDTVKDDYVFTPVTNVCRLIERLENPSGAKDAIVVRELDVSDMDASQFFDALSEMPGKDVHVWMPGERRWLLVGRNDERRVSLAAAMVAIAEADGDSSLPGLFANYAGRREELLPAFQSKLVGTVVPEWFLTREIPEINWIDDRGVDGDIVRSFRTEMRSAQVVRRTVLEGNMLSVRAKDKKGEEAAIEKWHTAALRNPEDLYIRERLDRLDRNARGFLALGKLLQAMKCYETMILIHPTAVSMNNFGMCLKKIGKAKLAECAFKRARELEAAARQ